MHGNEDLLNKLNKNSKSTSAEGSAKAEPRQSETSSEASVGSKQSISAATEQTGSAEEKSAAKTAENNTVTDPDSWTTESALREIKKLREENKASRLKASEQAEIIKNEMEAQAAKFKEELAAAKQAAKELDELKAKEADKKRSLEEKLSHRESLLAKHEASMEAMRREYETRLNEVNSRLSNYEAEIQAQNAVYRKEVEEKLSKIPEKFKDVANYIVKGAGNDPRDAFIALQEADSKGIFKEKNVQVVNASPSAAEGARASKERLESAAQAERSKMDSGDLIRNALKGIRNGESNSAFRRG